MLSVRFIFVKRELWQNIFPGILLNRTQPFEEWLENQNCCGSREVHNHQVCRNQPSQNLFPDQQSILTEADRNFLAIPKSYPFLFYRFNIS